MPHLHMRSYELYWSRRTMDVELSNCISHWFLVGSSLPKNKLASPKNIITFPAHFKKCYDKICNGPCICEDNSSYSSPDDSSVFFWWFVRSGTSSNDLDNWLVDELRTKGGYWEVEIGVHRHNKHVATLAAPTLHRQQRHLEMWPQWHFRRHGLFVNRRWSFIDLGWFICIWWSHTSEVERWRVYEVRLRRVWFKWAVSAQGSLRNQSLHCYTYLIPYYAVHCFLIIVPVL